MNPAEWAASQGTGAREGRETGGPPSPPTRTQLLMSPSTLSLPVHLCLEAQAVSWPAVEEQDRDSETKSVIGCRYNLGT